MNEFELIDRLCRHLPSNDTTRVGPGDDCAVVDLGIPGRHLLLKTDAVVEGVHFTADAPAARVGHKALARCLSDFAAMAGTPTHALVTLGLPRDFDVARVEAVYEGLAALARRHGLAVVGGETTANPGGLLLSVAVLGWVEAGREVRRAGARAGDALLVSGELGGAQVSGRHLEFEPRLAEARWLVSRFQVHAMIDVSDGLAGDLPHLLHASGVGAELLSEAVPISRAARQGAAAGGRPALAAALSDGEDFELLFTVASKDAVAVLDGWKQQFPGLRLSCIGRISESAGITLRDPQGVRPLTLHGFAHFQKP